VSQRRISINVPAGLRYPACTTLNDYTRSRLSLLEGPSGQFLRDTFHSCWQNAIIAPQWYGRWTSGNKTDL
jgi:hypothetical protein